MEQRELLRGRQLRKCRPAKQRQRTQFLEPGENREIADEPKLDVLSAYAADVCKYEIYKYVTTLKSVLLLAPTRTDGFCRLPQATLDFGMSRKSLHEVGAVD